eukprot:gene29632-38755_t
MGSPSSVTIPLQSATVGSGSDQASNFIAYGTPFQRPKIADSIIDTIGATPLIRLNRMNAEGYATILLKLESMEPASSVKDRIAKSMIEE